VAPTTRTKTSSSLWNAPAAWRSSDQDTEPDEQPDFRHDLAEAHGDRLNGPGEADAGSYAEVERGKKQRDDRVDFKPDDQTDG
jgi:hypothetical protein